MPFQKGHPVVKPTLGYNRNQLRHKMEIREFLEKFVKKYQKDMLKADMLAVEPKTRMQFMTNTLPYVTPHLSAVDVTTLGESIQEQPLVKYTTEELTQMRELAKKAAERNTLPK